MAKATKGDKQVARKMAKLREMFNRRVSVTLLRFATLMVEASVDSAHDAAWAELAVGDFDDRAWAT